MMHSVKTNIIFFSAIAGTIQNLSLLSPTAYDCGVIVISYKLNNDCQARQQPASGFAIAGLSLSASTFVLHYASVWAGRYKFVYE